MRDRHTAGPGAGRMVLSGPAGHAPMVCVRSSSMHVQRLLYTHIPGSQLLYTHNADSSYERTHDSQSIVHLGAPRVAQRLAALDAVLLQQEDHRARIAALDLALDAQAFDGGVPVDVDGLRGSTS